MKFAVSVFGNQPMLQIVERVKIIESLGFDAVWFGDLQRICREVYVEMTACALNTSRITLGIGVTMPTTDTPALRPAPSPPSTIWPPAAFVQASAPATAASAP